MEETIRRLRSDLECSRQDLLKLMPQSLQDLLRSYGRCKSPEQARGWGNRVAQKVTEQASAQALCGLDAGRLARCPLCGQGAHSPYGHGFTLPQGLRVHLVGSGTTDQCRVMRAVEALAQQHWQRRFHEARDVKGVPEPQLPGGDPAPHEVRTAAELQRAEHTLVALDFRMKLQERGKSYSRGYKPFVVYADPRPKRRIDFTVYARARLKSKRSQEPPWRALNRFSLPDGQYDFRERYEKRLAEAVLRRYRK